MSPADIIRLAIPGASDALIDHIAWGRTPFPVGNVTAKEFYKAARRWVRAGNNGLQLCEMCDRLATDRWLCDRCRNALKPKEEI